MRTFARLGRCRRLSKDREKSTLSSGSFIKLAMIQLMLHRLESRFGVITDRPPRFLDTADARAGAAENLDAFTRTLQLLGCFNSMSDDFSAQYVSRPRKAEA